MLNRRTLLAAASAVVTAPAFAAPPTAAKPAAGTDSFAAFVAGVKADARRLGIRQATLDRAFAGVKVNQKVIELDRRQPEFTMTWDQYRSRIVSDARIARGRELYAQHRALLARVTERFRVPAGPIMGIWGLESNYGQSSGGYNVIEALATLAWEGRRAAFFRSELMDALKILDSGDVPHEKMIGSYAGAMGQPQFMPDSFLKFAVDFSGTGKRDIWGDVGDVFGSVANYLAKSGWSDRLPWGVPARLPGGFDPAMAGRDNRKRIEDWARLGVQPVRAALPADAMAAVIQPGGPGGEAFLACHPNFLAIRRYNPSDFYCLSVGLIGDRVTA
ncbi:lytic murein transglycosylase [Limobrevibacterium gyesilva]|uniref:Lytic murein transglycosylase n=1 Tax=Limobrevibacterium gyesilva TaxID=2991712 RepID=A0AA41YJN7_9PROT|nr:lytic murein transglycosylase [Limobrevibacterium gyesilva]MCW3473820.1 lytic murein transglycosylase [Limobrevibacterium gyesilva]